ncbi:MAG: hypothetical protein DWQ04_10415 [Chloroflexi bacterium]|nr:MAG: hypothetical protein DWQ04_10415 [Chloroflexota bacterium]
MNMDMLGGDAMLFFEMKKRHTEKQGGVSIVAETAVSESTRVNRFVDTLQQINFAPLRPESIRKTTEQHV